MEPKPSLLSVMSHCPSTEGGPRHTPGKQINSRESWQPGKTRRGGERERERKQQLKICCSEHTARKPAVWAGPESIGMLSAFWGYLYL